MKTKMLFASFVLAGSALFGQVSFGVRIGPPPAPRVYSRPAAPGPGLIWVDGYWYPVNNRYRWHQGYWTRPPYEGARWIGPRHDGQQFYNGYWDGDRGRFDHDHRWDRDHDHDYRGEFHGDRH